MADLEKVIKGLDVCANGNGCTFGYHADCPYYQKKREADRCDRSQLLLDALELLKEQQEIINRYQWEDGEPK